MEAARFGFGPAMPPAFKFHPTDDDIVAHYLLPRALGFQSPPFAHAVIEDDPASLPPPDLLARHGHGASHHAFFVDTIDMSKNDGRRERAIKGGAGGLWRGQQSHFFTLTLLSADGREVDIDYKRYDLTYKKLGEEETTKGKKRKRENGNGNGGVPSGWVMHEYKIISPELQTTVLSRIKLTNGKIKVDRQQAEAEDNPAQHQVFAPTEQPGPSYYQEQPCPSYYQDFPCPSYYQEFPMLELPGPSSYQEFPMLELPGPSNFQHPLDMVCGGAGFSDGSQAADASFYGEDFAQQEQQPGPCYSHQPLDMVCGQGFSDGSHVNDAFCYRDNGGGMGDGFVNLLYSEEGFAGDNYLYCDGFNFSGGGDMEFTQSATEDTCPSNDQDKL